MPISELRRRPPRETATYSVAALAAPLSPAREARLCPLNPRWGRGGPFQTAGPSPLQTSAEKYGRPPEAGSVSMREEVEVVEDDGLSSSIVELHFLRQRGVEPRGPPFYPRSLTAWLDWSLDKKVVLDFRP